jgi:hypothetical protein
MGSRTVWLLARESQPIRSLVSVGNAGSSCSDKASTVYVFPEVVRPL